MVSQRSKRRSLLRVITAFLILTPCILAVLAPHGAAAQCTNIAGSWYASESGTINLTLTLSDGEPPYTESDPVSGSGVVTITQTGACTFQYDPIATNGSSLVNSGLTPSQLASLVRTVTVTGNNVTETGTFAILNTAAAAAEGLTVSSVTGNVETGTGQVTGTNPFAMTLSENADMVVAGTVTNNGETANFTLTVTSSSIATFTGIAITPPSQTSVASGVAYVGLFAAAGGSGPPYTWCILSGGAGSACLPSGVSEPPLPAGFSLLSTGLLFTTGTPAATVGSYPFTVQVTDSGGTAATQGFTLSIGCSMAVTPTTRDASTNSPTGAGMYAEASSPSGINLATAASACNFTSFEWQQTIWNEPCPSGRIPIDPANIPVQNFCPQSDAFDGADLTATTANALGDPPNGGVTNDTVDGVVYNPFPYYYPLNQVMNAESSPGSICNVMTGICLVTSGNKLTFYDVPTDKLFPGVPAGAASSLDEFKGYTTALVGVSSSATPGSIACGSTSVSYCTTLFSWTWTTTFNGTSGGISFLDDIGVNQSPPDPGSGTGGVTVTSINGVPTPAVTVTPSAADFPTTQGMTVTITVSGASGTSVPTGSISLSSGSYSSAPTTLVAGSATVTIPAGALAQGTDTLMAVYTPDNASAATFSMATGFALVDVTLSLTVTVNPSATAIQSAQSLSVTIIATGGSSNPTPTGTVVLSSGTYQSPATSLSAGSATITVPGGSLAAGTNTLTADYTPDASSSATYSSATGSASVTVTASPAATAPTFTPAGGIYSSAQTVMISDGASGATIYYTTNGSAPTTSSTVYSGPITVSSTETIEAMATASGYGASAVATATYTISTSGSGPAIQTVSAILPEQTQTITIAGSGFGSQSAYSGDSSYISFGDGSGATWQAGYTGPGVDDLVGLAIASWTDSQIVISGFTGSYGGAWSLSTGDLIQINVWNAQTGAGPATCNLTVGGGAVTCGITAGQTAPPSFSPVAGSYASTQNVTLSDATAGATIYYTTDGTTPTTSSSVYSGPITVSSTETIEAIATANGYSNSAVASATYTISLPAAPAPTFSPVGGIYSSAQLVTISDSTSGATIYYTTNGTTPTTSSTVYSGPVTVSSDETIEAIATASGYSASTVASATYTIGAFFSIAVAAGSSSTATVQPDGAATYTLAVTPVGASTFPAAITLAATGLPTGATATFTPSSVAAGGAATNVTLSIQTSSTSAMLRNDRETVLISFCVLVVPLANLRRSKRSSGSDLSRCLLLFVLLVASVGVLACGGGSGSGGNGEGSGSTSSPQDSTITVTASSGQLQQSATVTLTVQ